MCAAAARWLVGTNPSAEFRVVELSPAEPNVVQIPQPTGRHLDQHRLMQVPPRRPQLPVFTRLRPKASG